MVLVRKNCLPVVSGWWKIIFQLRGLRSLKLCKSLVILQMNYRIAAPTNSGTIPSLGWTISNSAIFRSSDVARSDAGAVGISALRWSSGVCSIDLHAYHTTSYHIRPYHTISCHTRPYQAIQTCIHTLRYIYIDIRYSWWDDTPSTLPLRVGPAKNIRIASNDVEWRLSLI